jgi:hypothetical protein
MCGLQQADRRSVITRILLTVTLTIIVGVVVVLASVTSKRNGDD